MRLVCACLLLLFSSLCFGQNQELKFITKFYDAVDKWVAFRGDSTYMIGFIYIDEEAGFTFRFDAITNSKLEKKPKNDSNSVLIYRLSENTANVAILSDKEIELLGLSKVPDWLEVYKQNENKNSYLVGLGYSYNHVGASHKAIEPLLKVYKEEPHFKGLEFELAYAYNAIKDFGKAIDVLNKAIKNDPKNFWFYRELGFTFINQNKWDDAEKTYLQGIELSTDKAQKAEMAFNMAASYFRIKNKPKFEKWLKLTKEYADKDLPFYDHIIYLEKNWDR